MAVQRRGNRLEEWEVALVKAMIADGRWPVSQDILAYFTRPSRSINARLISEVRKGSRYATIVPATAVELETFLAAWPDVDPTTGLNPRGDELLVKAREAMIAAVSTFNGAGLTFRAELFIVTAIIAWTYLLHAWFKREGIDYRHKERRDGVEVVKLTPEGAEKFWELSQCLKHARCPVDAGTRANLAVLIELRHEIEHRSTDRIDDALSAQLQACCINFNDALKRWFSAQHGLEKRLSVALQFVSLTIDQRVALKRATTLPRHIATAVDRVERDLTPEQKSDPRYAFHVAMEHRAANRPSAADHTVTLVPADSSEAADAQVIVKAVEKRKYRRKEVLAIIQNEGWQRFTADSHTKLCRQLDAKNPNKGFGTILVGDQWFWYDTWLDRVRQECRQHPERFRPS